MMNLLLSKVWHTSVLNKLDQVVAISYSRNNAEVIIFLYFTLLYYFLNLFSYVHAT